MKITRRNDAEEAHKHLKISRLEKRSPSLRRGEEKEEISLHTYLVIHLVPLTTPW